MLYPTLPPAETAYAQSLFDYCVERMALIGIPVILDPNLRGDDGNTYGVCDYDHIMIRPIEYIQLQLFVLLHEWAHFYLHQVKGLVLPLPIPEQEFEANCVALRLFAHLDISELCHTTWQEHLNENLEVMKGRPANYFAKRIDGTVWPIWSYITKDFEK